MRILRASHSQSAYSVGEAIAGLILDRISIWLLLHARLKTAPLDHEVIDYAMKNGAVIKPVFGILQKIGCRIWGAVEVQFDGNIAVISVKNDHESIPGLELVVNARSRTRYNTAFACAPEVSDLRPLRQDL